MKKLLIASIIIGTTSLLCETTPWKDWNNVTREDVVQYTATFNNTLQSSVKDINSLLTEHANNPALKEGIFHTNLKKILDTTTKDLTTHAKKFAKEIRSEATNTLKYKVQNHIPQSIADPLKNVDVKKPTKTKRKILTQENND